MSDKQILKTPHFPHWFSQIEKIIGIIQFADGSYLFFPQGLAGERGNC